MKIIDSHQHFWHYNPQKHAWIDDEMKAIRRDFTPEDLKPVFEENGIHGCIAVQADQTVAETDFLLDCAVNNTFIKGIVGWVDLRSKAVEQDLVKYAKQPLVKGFRHVLQGEKPEFMLQLDFLRGIGLLEEYGFTYDILIFPQHLESSVKLVDLFPNQKFIIDHCAKPDIKNKYFGAWSKGISELSKRQNVYCKVSGLVTEADYKKWERTDFTFVLDHVSNEFGTSRLVYGSDWPVCTVAASYKEVLQLATHYFSSFSNDEKEMIFYKNAEQFYKL